MSKMVSIFARNGPRFCTEIRLGLVPSYLAFSRQLHHMDASLGEADENALLLLDRVFWDIGDCVQCSLSVEANQLG